MITEIEPRAGRATLGGRSADGRRAGFRLGSLLTLVFYSALACWFLQESGLPPLAAAVAALAAGLVALLARRMRGHSTEQDAMLGFFAIAASRGASLGAACVAFADQCGGRYRRKVECLGRLLEQGVPLPEALDSVPGVIVPEAAFLVRVGDRAGDLAGACREASECRGSNTTPRRRIAARLLYLVVLLDVIQFAYLFFLFWLVPRFEAISRVLGVAPPEPSLSLFSLSHAVRDREWFLFPLFVLEQCALIALPMTSRYWRLAEAPIIDRWFRPLHAALVLRSIAWNIEGGVPFPRMFADFARWYPTRWVRILLGRVASDHGRGADWLDSMVRHRLLRPADAALLESAGRVGNLPWALRATAAGCERRLAFRATIWLEAVYPWCLFAVAGAVGFLAFSYFALLVRLFEAMNR